MTEFDVDIEKIVAGGDGLARHEGRVVFVPMAAPGERHRVSVSEEKKDYLRAVSVSCLTPAPTRREVPCSYYAKCGGCSLMHLEPSAQLEAKKNILIECLTRGKRLRPEDVEIGTTPSPDEGYRTRLRFHVSRRNDGLRLGFRKRGSHDVEDVEHCRLADTQLNACWRRIRRYLHREPWRVRGLETIELQESSHERGRIIGRFVVRSRDAFRHFDRDVVEALCAASGLDGAVVVSGAHELRAGSPYVHHRIQGITLRQSAGAFFQTNRFLLERLLELVAPHEPVGRVVDLYSGVGLFSVPLARRAGDVIGVETSPVAVRDAIANAKAAGAIRAQFVRADAVHFAEGFNFQENDYVVVDPPRGGLPAELRRALGTSPIRRICYVSCDPAAFGRDATSLGEQKFRLDRVELLDFFPNTHHFETVGLFTRAPDDAPLDPGPRDGRY